MYNPINELKEEVLVALLFLITLFSLAFFMLITIEPIRSFHRARKVKSSFYINNDPKRYWK